MARLGLKRQRLTRSEYMSRQLVEKALGIAERAGAAKPQLTKQQKDELMGVVEGREVGLSNSCPKTSQADDRELCHSCPFILS